MTLMIDRMEFETWQQFQEGMILWDFTHMQSMHVVVLQNGRIQLTWEEFVHED